MDGQTEDQENVDPEKKKPPKPNFTIIEGERKHSHMVVFDGHLYKREKPIKGVIFVKCKEFFSSDCGARGRIVGPVMVLTNNIHKCNVDVTYIHRLELMAKLKRAAETSTDELKSVFDEVTSDNPNLQDANLTYEKAISAMKRARALRVPANVSQPAEVIEYLKSGTNPEHSDVYAFHVTNKARTCKLYLTVPFKAK